ncbi:MAG TPA: NAD+ synthase, partial [Candidatus Saccharimonadales bacterium]|nr:NAD+ synthase [Candidatus Saccharimonadales bacterium]
FVFVNLVGGNDELVFDGTSFVVDAQARVVARLARFAEDFAVVDPFAPGRPEAGAIEPDVALLERALVLGIRDYLGKLGLARAVIGLSGGIDSSLVAAIAVDALGAPHVGGVLMPSRYSSEGSVSDAELLARALGIRTETLPIEGPFAATLGLLEDVLGEGVHGLTEENLQARIRGNLLMALSNSRGSLVLTTGNKSEMSTGYSTLYGDMAGGFAVIKDVEKTLVFRLARWRNERSERDVIPRWVIEKPPSAELRPNQRDTDSLPPYAALDPILRAYVEEDLPADEIAARGFDPELVHRVMQLVDRNEHKRRQAPPGPRITHRGLGRDRRMPITSRYREP